MPDWYPLMEAARHLGVAPWELLERPQYWIEIALAHKRGTDVLESMTRCPLFGKSS